jgi:hypothetical protein
MRILLELCPFALRRHGTQPITMLRLLTDIGYKGYVLNEIGSVSCSPCRMIDLANSRGHLNLLFTNEPAGLFDL